MKIPIEVSARHIHLCQKDLEALFGEDYELKKARQLYQPSDFAAEEVLDLKLGDKEIKGLRVVGPLREKTQVEISKTDAIGLGTNPPVRLSGDLSGSEGFILIGPEGEAELREGLIIAQRHIHCATEEAKELGLKNGDVVLIKTEGSSPTNFKLGADGKSPNLEVNSKLVGDKRPITFRNVKVRVRDGYKLCMHIDTDEGNAAGIDKKGLGTIL